MNSKSYKNIAMIFNLINTIFFFLLDLLINLYVFEK